MNDLIADLELWHRISLLVLSFVATTSAFVWRRRKDKVDVKSKALANAIAETDLTEKHQDLLVKHFDRLEKVHENMGRLLARIATVEKMERQCQRDRINDRNEFTARIEALEHELLQLRA